MRTFGRGNRETEFSEHRPHVAEHGRDITRRSAFFDDTVADSFYRCGSTACFGAYKFSFFLNAVPKKPLPPYGTSMPCNIMQHVLSCTTTTIKAIDACYFRQKRKKGTQL